MNGSCFYEDQMLAALCSGSISDDLSTHAAHCAECSEILMVARELRNEARAEATGTSVPDANIIWWRAQLRYQRQALKRATLPIRLAQGFSALCVVGVAAIGLQSLHFPNWLIPRLGPAMPLNPLIVATGTLTVVCAMIGGVYLAIAERVQVGRLLSIAPRRNGCEGY